MTHILKALTAAGVESFPAVRSFLEGPPYRIQVTERGGLYGLRYHRKESDFRSPVVRQARGIVLEKGTNRIVSWAFDKFYEYGEDAPTYRSRPNLRRSTADPSLRYERKYDGALIKVVTLPGHVLLVSTNGKINAADAPILEGEYRLSAPDGDLARPSQTRQGQRSLRELFAEVGGLTLPYEEGFCYAFELLHPHLPTVVPAKAPTLVHLMTRRLTGDFGEEPAEQRWSRELVKPAQVVKFRSFGACRDAAYILPWDDEGFVVVDSIGNRTKVKSDAYKAMQRLLAKDSQHPDEDALAIALTLHSSTSALPPALAPRITFWRASLDSMTARALIAMDRGGHRQAVERALGGRLPKNLRSVISSACEDWVAQGGDDDTAGRVSASAAMLHALRRSRLSLGQLVTALRAA